MQRSRRKFLSATAFLAGGLAFNGLSGCASTSKVRVNGHLWIYASKFPPDWDATPVLEKIFSDFTYAGIEGVEVMEVNLRSVSSVARLQELIDKYSLPVTGTSYYGDMWNKREHDRIRGDVENVVSNLSRLGGKNFGITVGDAGRKKTEDELDAQGAFLADVLAICEAHNVLANLHNHTFEVEHNLHDLKGTITRVPNLKLGPDINWLIRGGVDPVSFIETYGDRIVYLHIRDQTAEGIWTEYVGEGVTDFRAIADALKDTGFSGEVAIELAADEPPLNPMKENWKRSRAYVREVFGW